MIPFFLIAAVALIIAAFIVYPALNDRRARESLDARDKAIIDLFKRIDQLTVCRFSCGAKAVKLTAREANLASIGCAYAKIEPLREGDVLLNCTGTCDEMGFCPLKKIIADPIWLALALKAIPESGCESETRNRDGDARSVRYDYPGIPALARVCLRLGIKGFLFSDNGQLGFWCPPAPYPSADLADCADNADQHENRAIPRPDKL